MARFLFQKSKQN
jgi:hypothetical protein